MEDLTLNIGDILQDKDEGIRYRVVAIVEETVIFCVMDITKFQLISFDLKSTVHLIISGDLTRQEEDQRVVDIDALSDSIRADYENKLDMMREVEQLFGPDFLSLSGRQPKPGLQAVLDKHHVSKVTFWKLCRRYFQSGRDGSSLLDARALSPNKGCRYNFTKKPGRKPTVFKDQGVVLTQEDLDHFEEFRRKYKKGDFASWDDAYTNMQAEYYYAKGSEDGTQPTGLFPLSQMPTEDQFFYYLKTHLTHEEVLTAKSNAQTVRNNNRLLTGDPMEGVAGPMDLVELDACEMDVCLESITQKGRSVSHPTVYIMIDLFTRAIISCSVALEQNSVMGITNLFLNLGEDKQKYCKRYSIGLDDPSWWPSNVLPNRLRMDRGAEMASHSVEKICNSLGITRELAPPASGSMKPFVESSFHSMQSEFRTHLKHKGGVDHLHGSKPNEEACLNIYRYTQMVIAFVLYHNKHFMKSYKRTKEMCDAHVIRRPVELWKYGCEHFGAPKPIPNQEQYLFTLMTPINVKYNKKGIFYEGLCYIPQDDNELSAKMMKAQKKLMPLKGVRMDMRCIDAIYYLKDGRLMTAKLKSDLSSFANLTMEQWKAYQDEESRDNIIGEMNNQNQKVDAYLAYETIVGEAENNTPTSGKDIRAARESDRQAVNASMKMENRLPGMTGQDDAIDGTLLDDMPAALPEPASGDAVDEDTEDVDDGVDEDWLAAVAQAYDEIMADEGSASNITVQQ